VALLLIGSALGLGPSPLAAKAQDPSRDADDRERARPGFNLLMDGDADAAISVFRQIQQSDPQSPIGYLLEGEAIWWKIYYSTAHLLDPDVFDVASVDVSPYDFHYFDLVRVATMRAEAGIRAQQDVARNTLYEGMAHALTAHLDGLRGKDFSTARAGKKMRALLLSAINMDPTLTDANLGLGIYDYFVDTLPIPMKVLRVLGDLPPGNRTLGLQLIQKTAEHGDLLRGEAKFYLAKNDSRESENRHRQSLELFQELARDYPHNPLWPLLSASRLARLGQSQQADALYREVFRVTAKKNSQPDRAVHLAARELLVRAHPRESFGD